MDFSDKVPNKLRIIRELSRPLEPIPTEYAASLVPIPGVRAVIFDIYGTLFISASGDISLAKAESRESSLREAVEAVGFSLNAPHVGLHRRLLRAIEADHHRSREKGIDFPEVDICRIWRSVLSECRDEELIDGDLTRQRIERLAVEAECRVNPVWPMPHLRETLEALQQRHLLLGIVSNAQFFTPLLFEALLGVNCNKLGFNSSCCLWSYRERRGKPSPALFHKLNSALREKGVHPHEALFVGNDKRNDIGPAQRAGLKTCLFAGDQRSLRLREDDPNSSRIHPDGIITDLEQLRLLVS